jgi:uncharacterized protein YutE (UPF0331/DUF86 family)
MRDDIEKIRFLHDLRQEYQLDIEQRVKRYLSVKPHMVIPYTHFAAVSSEVPKLFRDGHFYGAIALSQAVSEALVRFMCECNSFRPTKDYEKNVAILLKRNLIDEELKDKLLGLWNNRHDYHHLNLSIEQDRRKLESLALDKTKLLNEIESIVFAFNLGRNGEIVPQHPKYWPDIDKGQMPVFLRCD